MRAFSPVAVVWSHRVFIRDVTRLARSVVSQIVDIVPELKDVGPWPSVGSRRSADEYGRIVEQQIPEECQGEYGPYA